MPPTAGGWESKSAPTSGDVDIDVCVHFSIITELTGVTIKLSCRSSNRAIDTPLDIDGGIDRGEFPVKIEVAPGLVSMCLRRSATSFGGGADPLVSSSLLNTVSAELDEDEVVFAMELEEDGVVVAMELEQDEVAVIVGLDEDVARPFEELEPDVAAVG